MSFIKVVSILKRWLVEVLSGAARMFFHSSFIGARARSCGVPAYTWGDPHYKPQRTDSLREERQTHISCRNKATPFLGSLAPFNAPAPFTLTATHWVAFVVSRVTSPSTGSGLTDVVFLHYMLYFLIFSYFTTRLPCFAKLL